MKSKTWGLILLLITLSVSNSFSQKIGLLMDSYVLDRWYIDQTLFEKKIKELGGETMVEIPYGDPDEQVRLGKKLIDSGVDALVIIPTDSKKAAEIVKAAKAVNIPVISYDRLILSQDISLYVSYNNEVVGNKQAEYALNKAPKGKYLLINGPSTDNNAILFRKGQLDKLKPYIDRGDVEIVGDYVLNDWSEIEALMKMDEFINTNDIKPDVILAANDAIATGCIQALPKEFIGQIIITGQDAELFALKHIISGNQAMTIYKPIKPLAFQAAEAAMKLAKKEKVSNTVPLKNGNITVHAILLSPITVDKTNYSETVVKDGHAQLSELLETSKK